MGAMNSSEAMVEADACYLALKAHDARFDGSFFTGVTSTGIYCRPVCRVRLPKRENCRFFRLAAQAERDGFRPCLRCRPELAPRGFVWSMQDASLVLAVQAAQLLDDPGAWDGESASVDALARRLGISDRHLRRIFEAHFGVTPVQYLQTRRLLNAKQLLTDTGLPITRIAFVSGYASVRRFNAAFVQHYGLNPSGLRAAGGVRASQRTTIRLGYRPPYDIRAMLEFFRRRQLSGVEWVSAQAGDLSLGRTIQLELQGQPHRGWIWATFDASRCQLALRVSDSLREVLPLLLPRVRGMLDLDADPQAINAVLHAAFPTGDGLRVPGTLDGFELAVRAVLGQQVTVAAGRTFAQRLADRFGTAIETPHAQLNRLFPSAQTLALVSHDELGSLGIVKQRQAAILALSRAVLDARLSLNAAGAYPETIAALTSLPGIGDWTAQYIAMRALRWPDAFPAADIALHKAIGLRGSKHAAREAEAASQAWRPWRSYAVIRTWLGAAAAPGPTDLSDKGKPR